MDPPITVQDQIFAQNELPKNVHDTKTGYDASALTESTKSMIEGMIHKNKFNL